MICEICGKVDMTVSWTDSHGVAQCCTCGTPYKILHYDENNNPTNKYPEIWLREEFIPKAKAYWEEKHRIMPSNCSFPGGQELATAEDIEAFNEWLEDE